MERSTTADTIKEITRYHLEERNGLLFGQCLSAVGWVGGTVPDCKNLVEIPMTDVAGSGFACGAALAGRRPIFVVRYQGFMWYNSSSLVNYAAKSKAIWGVPCPVFIRAIAMEGNGIGHTASSSIHSLFMHSPGMKVVAPMTPSEYQQVWTDFITGDDPMYVSEHRRSFPLTDDFKELTEYEQSAKITIIAISAARIEALEAMKTLKEKGVSVNLIHLVNLKPFYCNQRMLHSLFSTKLGLVIDSDYELCGASQSIAYELMHKTGVRVFAMGLEDRVCGVSKRTENITPNAIKIVDRVMGLLQ